MQNNGGQVSGLPPPAPRQSRAHALEAAAALSEERGKALEITSQTLEATEVMQHALEAAAVESDRRYQALEVEKYALEATVAESTEQHQALQTANDVLMANSVASEVGHQELEAENEALKATALQYEQGDATLAKHMKEKQAALARLVEQVQTLEAAAVQYEENHQVLVSEKRAVDANAARSDQRNQALEAEKRVLESTANERWERIRALEAETEGLKIADALAANVLAERRLTLASAAAESEQRNQTLVSEKEALEATAVENEKRCQALDVQKQALEATAAQSERRYQAQVASKDAELQQVHEAKQAEFTELLQGLEQRIDEQETEIESSRSTAAQQVVKVEKQAQRIEELELQAEAENKLNAAQLASQCQELELLRTASAEQNRQAEANVLKATALAEKGAEKSSLYEARITAQSQQIESLLAAAGHLQGLEQRIDEQETEIESSRSTAAQQVVKVEKQAQRIEELELQAEAENKLNAAQLASQCQELELLRTASAEQNRQAEANVLKATALAEKGAEKSSLYEARITAQSQQIESLLAAAGHQITLGDTAQKKAEESDAAAVEQTMLAAARERELENTLHENAVHVAKMSEQEQAIDALQATATEQRQEIETLNEEIASGKTAIAVHQQEIESLTAISAEQAAQAKVHLEEIQAAKEAKAETYSMATSKLEEVQAVRKTASEEAKKQQAILTEQADILKEAKQLSVNMTIKFERERDDNAAFRIMAKEENANRDRKVAALEGLLEVSLLEKNAATDTATSALGAEIKSLKVTIDDQYTKAMAQQQLIETLKGKGATLDANKAHEIYVKVAAMRDDMQQIQIDSQANAVKSEKLLRVQVTELEQELVSLRDFEKNFKPQLQRTQAALLSKTNQLAIEVDAHLTGTQEVQRLQQALAAHDACNRDLRAQVEQAETALVAGLATASAKNAAHEQELRAQQQALTEQHASHEALSVQLRTTQQNEEDLVAQNSALTSAATVQEHEAKSYAAQSGEENAKLTQENTQLNNALVDTRLQITQLENVMHMKTSQATHEANVATQGTSSLEVSLQQQVDRNILSNAEIVALKSQVDTLKETRDATFAGMAELEAMLTDQVKKNTVLAAARDDIATKLLTVQASHERDLAEGDKQLDEAEAMLEETMNDYAAQDKELDEASVTF